MLVLAPRIGRRTVLTLWVSWWKWNGLTPSTAAHAVVCYDMWCTYAARFMAPRLVALLFHRQHHDMRGARTSHVVVMNFCLIGTSTSRLGEFQGEDALAKHKTSLGASNLAGEGK